MTKTQSGPSLALGVLKTLSDRCNGFYMACAVTICTCDLLKNSTIVVSPWDI